MRRLKKIPENQKRKKNNRVKIKQIKAGGGVVFKKNKETTSTSQPLVLLIYRNGFWDIPKGKLEKGESIMECALREVAEEINADLPTALYELPTTYHEYNEPRKNYKRMGKTTHWYVMQFEHEQDFEPQLNEGITKVEWVGLDEAKKRVAYDNLKFVLEAFEEWYLQNQT